MDFEHSDPARRGSSRNFLPVNRQKGNQKRKKQNQFLPRRRSILHGTGTVSCGTPCARPLRIARGGRGWPTLLLVSLIVVGAAAPAFAINKPVLVRTGPRHDAFVRSAATTHLTATYDRDLSPLWSHMTLTGACGAVPGTHELEDPSETGGRRTIEFTASAPLSEGCNPYKASTAAYPHAGDPSFDSFTFRIDDTPPDPPAIVDPANGQVRADQPLVARGTAEPAATVHVVEGDEVIGSDRANSSGDFAVPLPYPEEDAVGHTISAFALDEAGNKSAQSTAVSFIHDSAAPQPPVIVTPPEGAHLNNSAVTVSGTTAKPSVVVRVHENGALRGTTTANASGAWSIQISFPAGSHTITATSYDGVSPDGPSMGRSFVVDLAPPAAPVIASPTEGQQIATTEVTVSGTAEPLARVRVREAGLLRATSTADGAGGWSTVIHFADGAHTITATAVDAAGNEGPAAGARTFTVDTAAPAVPVISSPAAGAIVATSAVTVSGAAEASSTVRVREGVVVLGTVVTSLSGSWSLTIGFADGAHSITATATDAAGNVSPPSAVRTFAVDTVAPSVPAIVDPAEGASLSTSSVTIRGTADPGSTVSVKEGAAILVVVAADTAGVWRATTTFSNGAHSITATAADAAGNTSQPSPPRTFTVTAGTDTTPPAEPIITAPTEGSTQRPAVVFEGTAEPGATVLISEGDDLGNTTAAPSGSWRLEVDLAPGAHAVVARARDAAGNVSPTTAARTFTVDAQAPTVSFATADGAVFPPGTPASVAGSAADAGGVGAVEIAYYDLLGTRVLTAPAACAACPATTVTWSHQPSLGPGRYTVDAYAVDRAGNRSSPARIRIVVL